MSGPGAQPLAPVVLEGAVVRLEPLTRHHLFALAEVGLDPSLWVLTVSQVHELDAMRRWVERALAQHAAGEGLPFVTIERASGRVVGSTRFMAWVPEHRRVEIGSTWVAPPWQRTAINTEAKFLMLEYAFGTLQCQRVEFKTDVLNVRSRAAIARLGAREEGIFRRHVITDAGRTRDTVYFAITDEEWPEVRARLGRMLGGADSPSTPPRANPRG